MGWTRSIKFDHDFVGREALEVEVARPRRTVVTLELDSNDIVDVYASLFRDGDAYRLFEIPQSPYSTCWTDWILSDGAKIGHATFPGYSLYFRKMLALSFVNSENSVPGTSVTLLWGNPGDPQTEIRAKVAPAPYLQAVGKFDRRRNLREVV